MFHVHGHQDSCLFWYATAFIKGAEMVNGKILETLWSTLNSISPSLCTATLAHQSEVLDDHMNDGNWKKMVSMSEYLEWGWFNISLAALLFQPQKLLKITSEQWKARKIAVSTLSSSQKPPPANSWHLGRSKYWMPKLDELMSHRLWMLWPPRFLKVGWLFSNDLDQTNRWNSSANTHPEAAWISAVTRKRCIWEDCLDNFRPETWGTTVSPVACLHLTIAWDVNRL